MRLFKVIPKGKEQLSTIDDVAIVESTYTIVSMDDITEADTISISYDNILPFGERYITLPEAIKTSSLSEEKLRQLCEKKSIDFLVEKGEIRISFESLYDYLVLTQDK